MPLQAPFIFTLVFLCAILTSCYAIDTIYLDDPCGRVYTVNRQVKIKITDKVFLDEVFDCTLTLKTNSGSRLRARFLSYTQGEFKSLGSSSCDRQAIYLNNFFGSDGYCDFWKPSDNYDLGKQGTYRYVVPRSSSFLHYAKAAKAELLVTEVTDKKDGGCPSGFFDCETNNACIDEDLTCNSYDNCGNDRDEIQGCGLSTGAIVGIVFGGIGFIVIVAVGVMLFLKFR